MTTVTKLNSLEIENLRTDDVVQHLPNGGTNIGLGFNYKRLGLGIAVGFPKNSESQRKFGKTRKLDIQGSIYGKTIGGEAFLQHYKGYYNSNPEDFLDWNQDSRPQLPSMEVWSIGLVGFYIFNSKKYSYRAAFVKDEIQTKSTGSFLAGIFGNLDESSTNNGFIPQEYPDSIKVNVNVKKFRNLATGVSLGYAYNLIVGKKILAGLALLPGFGFQNTTYETLSDEVVNKNQAAAQKMRHTESQRIGRVDITFAASASTNKCIMRAYKHPYVTKREVETFVTLSDGTILVTDGTNTYAIMHIAETPFSESGLSAVAGKLYLGGRVYRIAQVAFLGVDPRIVVTPVTLELAP